MRRTGLLAIKLKPDDQLIWVKPTTGSDQIQMMTAAGQAVRFKETDVRDMGRGASGVIGMRLKRAIVLWVWALSRLIQIKLRTTRYYQLRLMVMAKGLIYLNIKFKTAGFWN